MGKTYVMSDGKGREIKQSLIRINNTGGEIKNIYVLNNGASRNIFVREKYVWGGPGGTANSWGVSAPYGQVQHTGYEATASEAVDVSGFNTMYVTWWGGNQGNDVNGDYSGYGGQVRRRTVCYVGTASQGTNLSVQAPGRSTTDNFMARTFTVNVVAYNTVYISLGVDVAGGGMWGDAYIRNVWLN